MTLDGNGSIADNIMGNSTLNVDRNAQLLNTSVVDVLISGNSSKKKSEIDEVLEPLNSEGQK